MMDDLKQKSVRGAMWSAIDALGSRLVHLVIGIVLARLLLPEQFGLIGMLSIFMGISHVLLNSGFSFALIQKEEVTDVDSASVFYFNLAISLMLAFMLALSAPCIARFYNQPILTPLMRALSLVLVADALSVVPLALLNRKLDFKVETKARLVSAMCSGAVAIGMAYQGYGVWSLVAQQLSSAVLRAALLWLWSKWRPRLVFSLHSLRQMFRFGSRLVLSALISQAFSNVYYVIIGRLFSPAALGFYSRAKHMKEIPSGMLSKALTRVSFPAFSAIQTDDVRLTRALRKALQVSLFWNAPVMVGLAVVAEPLVLVLLTDTWLPAVPYLQLLCAVGLTKPLHALNLTILTAKGRSDLFLRLSIIKKIPVIIGILIFWRWGVIGLIVSEMITAISAYLINSYYTRRLLRYGPLRQLADTSVYLLFAAIMGVGVYLLRILPFSHEFPLLLTQTLAGVLFYGLLCSVFRPPAFVEQWALIKSKIRRPFVASEPSC